MSTETVTPLRQRMIEDMKCGLESEWIRGPSPRP